MEDSKTVSVSRVYVPNHYRVFLSPAGPRAVLELRAGAAQGAVGLPARARPHGGPGAHQPPGGGVHDRRPPEPGRVRHPGAAAHQRRGGSPRRATRRPRRATSGTRWSTRPTAAPAGSSPSRPSPPAPCWPARAGAPCSAADTMSARPQPRLRHRGRRRQRVAPPRRAARRRRTLADRGPRAPPTASRSTAAGWSDAALEHGDRITLGVTDLDFELE